jgi:hypothetical protein
MLRMDDSFAADLMMVLDDTLLDACDVDDDDKLQSLAVIPRDDSMDPRPKVAIDPEFDYFPTTTVDCFAPAVSVLLDPPAVAGQLSIRIDDVLVDRG